MQLRSITRPTPQSFHIPQSKCRPWLGITTLDQFSTWLPSNKKLYLCVHYMSDLDCWHGDIQSMSSLEREWRIKSYWDWVMPIYTDVEMYLDTLEDWDRHPVWSSSYTAQLENFADHHRFFLQLWGQKELGFLQAKQSSRELKKAVWQYKGQDGVVQSNLRHMECCHWGQKGDLLKDKIKLKKGERRGAACWMGDY